MNILEVRRRLLEGGVKKRTAEGNPIVVRSLARMYPGLNIYGWSKQDGTPTPENPVPIVSAGSVMVESKNLFEDYGKKISVNQSSTYYISTGETDAKRIDLACYDEQMQLVTEGGLSQTGSFYLQANGTYRVSNDVTNINVSITTGENTKYVEFIIPSFQTDGFPNLMLNTGSTALPYEPYFTPYADPDQGEINVTVQGGNLVDIPDIPAGDGGLNVTIPVDISETFTVSVDDSDVITINNVWRLRFGFEDGTLYYAVDGTFPVTVNVTPENKVVNIMYCDIRIESGTYKNFMLNAGSTPLPYMPYKQPQTLTAQTPGGLPGIPVSSGGNYTDESGQQWICDEVDFKRGVYVQRVWKGTFDGSEDENWIVYASDSGRRGFACLKVLLEETNRKDGLSNQFVVGGASIAGEDIIWIGVNNKNIYALTQEWFDKGVDAWKAHLAAHPLEVMTYLETPIETDLSDEEISAYKALHTYSPATTVNNDAGAWMKAGYKTRKSL